MLVFASCCAVRVHYARDTEPNFPALRIRRWGLATAGLLVVSVGEGAGGRAAESPFPDVWAGWRQKLLLLEGSYPLPQERLPSQTPSFSLESICSHSGFLLPGISNQAIGIWYKQCSPFLLLTVFCLMVLPILPMPSYIHVCFHKCCVCNYLESPAYLKLLLSRSENPRNPLWWQPPLPFQREEQTSLVRFMWRLTASRDFE